MTSLRWMRLGRRLLVCAALAMLTRKAHGVATEPVVPQALPAEARLERGSSEGENRGWAGGAPSAYAPNPAVVEASNAEAMKAASSLQ